MSEKIFLNSGWKFSEVFCEEYLAKDADFTNLEEVCIPHTVKETSFNYFDEHEYQKISAYYREIKVPMEWKDKSVRITFEGIAHYSVVYVNGTEKAAHSCGYTSFTVDLSDYAIPDETIKILVKVDSRESLNQPPFGYVIDYMTYGGIYRDVYIEVSEKTYLENVFLYSEFKDNGIITFSKVRINNPKRIPVLIKQTLNGITHSFEVKGNGGMDSLLAESFFDPGDVKLWSIEEPVLYTVKTEMYDTCKTLLDSREDRIGFRKSEFKEDGYYLNNKKVRIRGLNRHQSFPYVGYAMPSSMQILDAEIIKNELCLNAVRTSHYPQSQDFIDKCDELGILVFTEIPGWQHIGDEEWKKQAVLNTRDMVRQYRNHPSVILWGVRINESADDDDFYKRTNEIAHRYDPSRPTGGVRALKNSNLFEDVYTYNDFVHDGKTPGCEPKKKVTSDAAKPYLISEYNGHMYPTKSFDWEEHRREHAIRHANVLNAVAGEPGIAGSFGWCMFDYNTHKDFGSGDRICYHGVMDMFRNPKLASVIYACESDKETVLEISSSMDIGEHPGCNRGAVWIFSNADSVRMYKNDKLLKEYTCSDSPYKNLKHGPIMVDDFVGNAVEERENYSPKLCRDIKEMMNATALYGLSNLPKRTMLLAAKAMLIHHLTMGDAVRLYNKYVGDWGGTSTVYKFEAVKDGKVVKTLVKEPVTKVSIKAVPNSLTLKPGKTYDVAAIRIMAVDQNDNVLPFFNEPVTVCVKGDAEVIGPKIFSLKGGMGGTYIKTTKETSSDVELIISSEQCGECLLNFKVERDTKWNVLK